MLCHLQNNKQGLHCKASGAARIKVTGRADRHDCVLLLSVLCVGREWDVPVEVFDSIETLLPTGKGLFLELWAPTQAGRAGWTHMVEQPAEQHV